MSFWFSMKEQYNSRESTNPGFLTYTIIVNPHLRYFWRAVINPQRSGIYEQIKQLDKARRQEKYKTNP